MRADAIASKGRTGLVGAVGISTSGRISRLAGLIAKSFINAYMFAERGVKIFRAVTRMDRVFRGTTEM